MCDLATGLSIAGAAFNFMKQSQAAEAQSAAITNEQNAKNAAVQAQYNENRQNLTEQASQAAIDEKVATAQLRAVAGESGLSGGSQERAVSQAQVTYGRDIATIEANRVRSAAQAERGIVANNTSAAAKQSSVTRPSIIGTGLQIAGAYNDYQTRQESKRVPTAKA